MNGEAAQKAALTAYANAYLQGHKVAFGLDHPTASHCRSIEFVDVPQVGSLKGRNMLAKDPESWFSYLATNGIHHLRLHYGSASGEGMPDRSSVAFSGGGGYWFIETVSPAGSTLWESVWRVPSNRGKRIWKVWYFLSKVRPEELQDTPYSIEDVRRELQRALVDISSFAKKHDDTKEWVSYFQRALDALDSEYDVQTTEILPAGCFTRDAEQLMAASRHAFVFGGMGSWNDVLFGAADEIQKEYDRVSNRLYGAICRAIVTAVNSFPKP